MPNNVEKQVVSLNLDYSGFEKGAKVTINTIDKLKDALSFKKGTDGIDNIQKAVNKVDFSAIQNGIESLNQKFSASGLVFQNVISNITNTVMNKIRQVWNEAMVVPVREGFGEYELKMGSVQTIMASTGASLEEVNGYLQELNTYADKTIYSFSDMTASIGKFTNAGVKLEDAVKAIQGISNEAAISGAGAQEASRAMYNFAQALSAGAVKLIDWKSIENANMATVEFKQKLIDSAVALGTVVKVGDKYQSTTTGLNGGISELFDSVSMFNDSLSAQWMTTEVLVKTLGEYADETTEIGKKAFAAAQDVKTWTQLLDTLKEALGSGWATSFELIIGDYDEAKELFTKISNTLGNIIDTASDTRNAFIQMWRDSGGREKFLKGVDVVLKKIEDLYSFIEKITDWLNVTFSKKVAVAKEMEEAKKKAESFKKVLDKHPKTMHEAIKMLKEEEEQIKTNTEATKDQISELEKQAAKDIWFTGKYGNGEERRKALEAEGLSYEHVQSYLEEYIITGKQEIEVNEEKEESIDKVAQAQKKYTDNIDKYAKTMRKAGYSEIAIKLEKTAYYISGIISNLFESVKNVGKAIGNMINVVSDSFMQGFHFDDLFGIFYNVSEWIKEASEGLLTFSKENTALKHTLTYIFDIISRFGTMINFITKVATKIFKTVNKLLKPTIKYILRFVGYLTTVIVTIATKLKRVLIDISNRVHDLINNVISSGLFSKIHDVYNFIINKIINPIKEKIPEIIIVLKAVVIYAISSAVRIYNSIKTHIISAFEIVRTKLSQIGSAIKTFLQPAIDFFKKIFNAVKSFFDDLEVKDELHEVNMAVIDTSDHIVKTTDVVEELGEKFTALKNKISTALQPVKDKITAIKDAIVGWVQKLNLAEKASKVWSVVSSAVKTAYVYVKEFIAKYVEIFKNTDKSEWFASKWKSVKETFATLFNWIGTNAPIIFGKLVDGFKKTVDFITNLVDTIKTKFSEMLERIKNGENIWESFFGMFKDENGNVTIIETIKEKFNALINGDNGFTEFIEKVKDVGAKIKEGFSKIVGSFNILKMIELGTIISLVRTIIYLIKGIKGLIGIGGGVTDILKSIKKGVDKVSTALAQKLKVKYIERIIALIVVLVAAIVVLSTIPEEKLWNAVTALVALFVVIEAIIKVYGKIQLKLQEAATSSQVKAGAAGRMFLAIAALIASMGVAAYLIMKATEGYDKINIDMYLLAFMTMLVSIMALVSAVLIIMKFIKGMDADDSNKLLTLSAVMIAMSVAVLILSLSVSKFAKIFDNGDTWYNNLLKSVLPVLLMIGMLALLAKASQKARHVLKAAAAMVIISVVLRTMMPMMMVFATLPFNSVMKVVIAMAVLMAGFASLILAASTISDSDNVLKVAAVITLLTAALYFFVKSGVITKIAEGIQNIDIEKFGIFILVAVTSFALLTGALVAFGMATATVAPALMVMGKSFLFFGVGLLAVSAATFIFMAAFELFPNAIDNIIRFGDRLSERAPEVIRTIITFVAMAVLGIALGALAVKSKVAFTIVSMILSILAVMVEVLGDKSKDVKLFITNLLFALINFLGDLIDVLVKGIVGLIIKLIYALASALASVNTELGNAIEALVEALTGLVITVITKLISGMTKAIAKILRQSGIGWLEDTADDIEDNMVAVDDMIASMNNDIKKDVAKADTTFTNSWEELRKDTVKELKESKDAMSKELKDSAETFKKDAEEYGDKTSGGVAGIGIKLSGAGNGVTDALGNLGDAMNVSSLTAGENSAESFTDGYLNNIDGLDMGAITGEGIVDGVEGVDFNALGVGVGDDIQDGINEKDEELAAKAEETAELIADSFDTMSNKKGRESGKNWILGLVKGIKAYETILYGKTRNVAEEMNKAFEDEEEIESPSKVMAEDGRYWVMGIVKGIKSTSKDLYSEVVTLSNGMIDNFGNPIDDIQDILDSDIDIQPRICPVIDLTGVKTGSETINGLLAPQTELMAQIAGAQMNINQEIDTTYDDSSVISTIEDLKDEISDLKTYISTLKVTLDSGALVGQIAGRMDMVLGQRQVYKSRHN